MDCDDFPLACQLERIADAMTGFDWNNFASTLLATLIGAGVAAGVSFWLARVERPTPVWRVDTGLLPSKAQNSVAGVSVTATNMGDGTAYNVMFAVDGSTRSRSDLQATVEPGGSIKSWAHFPMTGERKWDPTADAIEDSRSITWAPTTATVTWQQPPRRHTIRRKTFKVDPPIG